MAILHDRELPDDVRALWLRAMSAMELRNYAYAISLIQAVLKKQPAFLDGRKILRRAEVAATKGKKSLLSGFSTASLKGTGMVKKDPIAAMELAEKTLESDPYNGAGNHLLKEAAKAAGQPETAVFALQTLIEANPKDTKLMHELGELFTEMGDADDAVKIYTRITEINPADLIAVKRSKDASASATMKKGGWETATTYRDLMKDKDEAIQLEQKGRVFKDLPALEAQIAELGAQYEQQPESVDLVRRIAHLYDQKQQITLTVEDLAAAVEWYGYANQLSGGSDPAVARKLSDLELKKDDHRIRSLEEWFAAGGDQHEEAETLRAELNDLIQKKAEKQIAEARRRVERNPTDLQLRYELGERLVQAGHSGDAIQELQRAKSNPNVRIKAMNLLGYCFAEKHMLDMAVSQYKTAASELSAMDAMKKEIVYKLGLIYEQQENKAEYLNCMKEIYEVDYGYRDVAKRVESSYG